MPQEVFDYSEAQSGLLATGIFERERMIRVAIGLLLLLSSVAFAQEPSFDFKGILLGSDISAVERSSRFSCRSTKDPIADRICSLKSDEKETIAGMRLHSLMLYYYAGKLETISISLDEKHFSQVIAALVEKYGQGATRTEQVQNRLGAAFENKIYSWRRNNATLQAKRYAAKLDTSEVIYRTDFALEEFARRSGTSAKEKSKDM